jgi:hypothetical protein
MSAVSDSRYQTAHHEAGHAVATLLRGGGELLSITIAPAGDYLGHTESRTKAVAGTDRLFITFAGPWAEARAQWAMPSLDREDDDGCTFDDHLCGAWMVNADGDSDAYEDMRGEEVRFAEYLGITPGELRDRRERGWGDELERAWPVIQQVAKLLLAGDTVTDAVVREFVDGMWGDELAELHPGLEPPDD